MIAIALAIGTPFFIFFGWLSDKIGRKPIIMLGFLLAAVTYAPISPINIFKVLTHYAIPSLEKALASAPVTVVSRSLRVFVPVQDDRSGEVLDLVRYGESCACRSLGQLQERGWAEGHSGSGESR
jgi:hypothetical protein